MMYTCFLLISQYNEYVIYVYNENGMGRFCVILFNLNTDFGYILSPRDFSRK